MSNYKTYNRRCTKTEVYVKFNNFIVGLLNSVQCLLRALISQHILILYFRNFLFSYQFILGINSKMV
jgi:hypothetical protein